METTENIKKRPAPGSDEEKFARKRFLAKSYPESFLEGFYDECSPEDHNDKELILTAVRKWGEGLKFASEDLRIDLDVVAAAVRNDRKALEYCPKLDDREFLLKLTQSLDGGYLDLSLLDTKFLNDVELVAAAVMQNGMALEHASQSLKTGEVGMPLVNAAVNNNGLALQFAATDLRRNRDLVVKAVSNDGQAIFYASQDLWDDKYVVLSAIKHMKVGEMVYSWQDTPFPSPRLQQDRDVLLAIAAIDYKVMLRDNIPVETRQIIRRDREFALQVFRGKEVRALVSGDKVEGDNENLYLSEALKNFDENVCADREVVMEAVSRYGAALRFASAELKNDPDVVKAAINAKQPMLLKNDGEVERCHALSFASEAFRNDPEIVMAALKKCGFALEFLPEQFRSDPVFVEASMSTFKMFLGRLRIIAFYPEWIRDVIGSSLASKIRQARKYLIRIEVLRDPDKLTSTDDDLAENDGMCVEDSFEWTYKRDDPSTIERFRTIADENLHTVLEKQRLLETIANRDEYRLPEAVIEKIKSFFLTDEINEAENLSLCMPTVLTVADAFGTSTVPSIFAVW